MPCNQLATFDCVFLNTILYLVKIFFRISFIKTIQDKYDLKRFECGKP